jgi:hypothetical protein
MKLRYVGESFGVDSLTNGKIYEVTEEDEDFYRVIDDSGEGYLYSKVNPAPLDGSSKGGVWELVSADEMSDQLVCSVCEKYRFDQADNHEICVVCGWENDTGEAGKERLLAYRAKWKKENAEWVEYLEAMSENGNKVVCPVCGKYIFQAEDDFEVCRICGWENDGFQYRHPDFAGGANDDSLNQYRERWLKEQADLEKAKGESQ